MEDQTTTQPARRRLVIDLTLIIAVAALVAVGLTAGGILLYRTVYSPAAFVQQYLGMLSDGRAADALRVPGVAIDAAAIEAAGLSASASDALLRRDALAALEDVSVIETATFDDVTHVVVEYRAGGYTGHSTFRVEQDGWIGFLPTWRFAQSPLAVIDVTVRGSMSFDVNGFTIDKRQVSIDGMDADPLAAVPLLVFSPGLYSVSVDTPIAATPGVNVLADAPLADVPIALQAEPTAEFLGVVQERVEEYLTQCATQQVLQPTGCPFGYYVENRIDTLPAWSIIEQPVVQLEPKDDGWAIVPASALAHIDVDIRMLFDGSIRTVSEDVPFTVDGTITIRPDGRASITIGGGM